MPLFEGGDSLVDVLGASPPVPEGVAAAVAAGEAVEPLTNSADA